MKRPAPSPMPPLAPSQPVPPRAPLPETAELLSVSCDPSQLWPTRGPGRRRCQPPKPSLPLVPVAPAPPTALLPVIRLPLMVAEELPALTQARARRALPSVALLVGFRKVYSDSDAGYGATLRVPLLEKTKTLQRWPLHKVLQAHRHDARSKVSENPRGNETDTV
jgi:hypothetical protein